MDLVLTRLMSRDAYAKYAYVYKLRNLCLINLRLQQKKRRKKCNEETEVYLVRNIWFPLLIQYLNKESENWRLHACACASYAVVFLDKLDSYNVSLLKVVAAINTLFAIGLGQCIPRSGIEPPDHQSKGGQKPSSWEHIWLNTKK